MATVAAAAAAVLCLVLGGVGYLAYINEQQISYLEASTSYGECKQVLLPDGTQLVLNSCSRIPVSYTHLYLIGFSAFLILHYQFSITN